MQCSAGCSGMGKRAGKVRFHGGRRHGRRKQKPNGSGHASKKKGNHNHKKH